MERDRKRERERRERERERESVQTPPPNPPHPPSTKREPLGAHAQGTRLQRPVGGYHFFINWWPHFESALNTSMSKQRGFTKFSVFLNRVSLLNPGSYEFLWLFL